MVAGAEVCGGAACPATPPAPAIVQKTSGKTITLRTVMAILPSTSSAAAASEAAATAAGVTTATAARVTAATRLVAASAIAAAHPALLKPAALHAAGAVLAGSRAVAHPAKGARRTLSRI